MRLGQVFNRNMSESEPTDDASKSYGNVKTVGFGNLREECKSNLLTDCAAFGV